MPNEAVVISDFSAIQPEFRVSQRETVDWLIACHAEAERCRGSAQQATAIAENFARYAVKDEHIGQRFVDCGDLLSRDWTSNRIYRPTEDRPHGADALERNRSYGDKASAIFRNFYFGADASEAKPDHLIHVTCTGYVSPSAAQRVVADTRWLHPTEITHAYHMGCYAALPAVRMAEASVITRTARGSSARVDVVHTEICALHLTPGQHRAEQILVQTLFADGHIKYSFGLEDGSRHGLRVLSVTERIVPNSQDDITWVGTSAGMLMTLAKEVPAKIAAGLPSFVSALASSAGLDRNRLIHDAIFAVHPGGPKIIDTARDVLGLREEQVACSREVLRTRGNMSSATLPHVWQLIMATDPALGQPVVSLAFGPGLTLFGAVFVVV